MDRQDRKVERRLQLSRLRQRVFPSEYVKLYRDHDTG
jgi:hypothetical protein